MTIVIIGPHVVVERRRRELGLARDGFIWISPRDTFAITRLRGRWQEGLEIHRPSCSVACPEVEEFLHEVRAVEK